MSWLDFKIAFSRIFLEKLYHITSPGAYTCSKKSLSLEFLRGNIHGAPLLLYLRSIHAFVGADRCVVRKDPDLRVFCWWQKLCPPVSKVSFDFGKTTAKFPFLTV